MLPLSILRKALVTLCVFTSLAYGPFFLCFAQRTDIESNVLPLSTAYMAVSGEIKGKTIYSTIEWKGRKFQALEGTTVLMDVITNTDTDATTRGKALQNLKRLRNRDINPQLIALYEDFTNRKEKLGTISCLIASEEPRGLPLFVRILEQEKDNMVRLFSAVALAHWNVRSGVAELIRILEECKDYKSADRTVCNEASKEFAWLNARKDWRFPEDRTRQEIILRKDLSDEEMSAQFIIEIQKWFAENKHRFPEWKAGDPLPKIEQKNKSD